MTDLLERIRAAASGRWGELLQHLGSVPADFLVVRKSKEGPCPNCGGNTRFRYDDKLGNGEWFCSHCGGKDYQGGGGTGFDLLMRMQGWTFPEALRAVAQYLGVADQWRLPDEFKGDDWDYVWRYSDEFVIVRKDEPGQRKQIRPFHWDGRQWVCKRPDGSLPLYNRAELRRRPDVPVLVVEGEKAADAAIRLFPDLVVITWHGGTKNVGTADWSPLRDRALFLWPDADLDGGGLAAMKKVAAIAPASEFWLITPPEGVPDTWDLADAVAAGWTPDQAMDWLQQHKSELEADYVHVAAPAPQVLEDSDLTPEEEALWSQLRLLAEEEDLAKRRYRLAKLAQANGLSINLLMQLMESVLDPEGAAEEGRRIFEVMEDDELFAPCTEDPLLLHYLLPGLVPVGEAVLLVGEAKAGKSLLMYEAIHAVLNGGEFLGEPCRKGKVLLLQLEENNSLKMRLAAKGINTPENRGRFRVIRNYDATNPKALDQLRRELVTFKPDLVCLDSLRGAMSYSEESENLPGFTRPIKRVIKLCQNANAGLIAIHHTNKSKEATGLDKIAGTKALVGEFWGVLQLEKLSDRQEDPDRALAVTPRDGARLRMHIQQVIQPGEPFRWEHLGNLAGDLTSPNLRHQLLALLQSKGELRTREVCSSFPDEKEETIRRALYRLREMGLVTTRKGHADGSGRPPTLWSINSDHFGKGMTVTTPYGSRDVYQNAVDPPLPASTSTSSVSQNPADPAGFSEPVTKNAQNPEAPKTAPVEEESSFVTLTTGSNGRGGGEISDRHNCDLQLLDDPVQNTTLLAVFRTTRELTDEPVMRAVVAAGLKLSPIELMRLRTQWEEAEGSTHE